MRTLLAPTEEFIKLERSTIQSDATAGSDVSITIGNNDGFAETDYVAIGYQGSELCELVQINQAVSAGQTIRVDTLKFNHKAGEPVTRYRYNKRKFYGSATETGSYTELTSEGSPKNIQVDDPQGTYIEYTGSTYAYFKATYYNSHTTEETVVADSNAVSSDETLRYASIYAIRKHAGLAGNPFYSDARIEIKRKQAENEINSFLYSLYILPLTEVPAILGYICELLAAGYIDYEEFGSEGEGVKWLGTARAILKSIADGKQRLIGVDGIELTQKTSSTQVTSYPDQVNNDDDDGPSRKFSMNQRF